MSMKECPVEEYGMLLPKELMMLLASKICDDFNEDDYREDPYGFNESVENAIGDIEYIGDFCGEAFLLNDEGGDRWSECGETYGAKPIYYYRLQNWPTLFRAAYDNMDEVIAECKGVFKNYLPDDFDYRNQLRHIVGTYYG